MFPSALHFKEVTEAVAVTLAVNNCKESTYFSITHTIRGSNSYCVRVWAVVGILNNKSVTSAVQRGERIAGLVCGTIINLNTSKYAKLPKEMAYRILESRPGTTRSRYGYGACSTATNSIWCRSSRCRYSSILSDSPSIIDHTAISIFNVVSARSCTEPRE